MLGDYIKNDRHAVPSKSHIHVPFEHLIEDNLGTGICQSIHYCYIHLYVNDMFLCPTALF